MSKPAKLQPPRGTRDLLGEELARHTHVIETAGRVARGYGFAPIETPVFELAGVFDRSLGETSDVVSKEMYSFRTHDEGELYCLRPENTAGVVRAFISGGMQQNLPAKFSYNGPMFRHERPQKGRYRQFTQYGVELLGVASPFADLDVIACGQDILDALGLSGRIQLRLNTLGDAESRAGYRNALIDYFAPHRDTLSAESQARLTRNPLRILDSKDAGDRKLIADAPHFDDYLNVASTEFFAQVCEGLDALGIAWQRDATLVRGLDYYCHTAFEFVTTDLGAQGTVLGGGRYDGLIALLGGPALPGVGFAGGIDRLALMLDAPKRSTPTIALIPIGEAAQAACLPLAHRLRRAGLVIDMAYEGNVGKRMKRANKIGAWASVVIGEDELAANQASLRMMADGSQRLVAIDTLDGILVDAQRTASNISAST